MTPTRDVIDHLKFFDELGMTGISRDPSWRVRVRASDASPLDLKVQGSEEPPELREIEGAPDRIDGAPDLQVRGSAALAVLRAHIGPDCTRCKLGHLGRKQTVFGVGNPDADLMFVGEAPGADEDAQGEPFVGRAGQLLTKIIEAIDLKREDVYIANVLKCRPPGNRAPEPDEVAMCEPFLLQQIEAIRPRVIVALGAHAAHALLKTDAPISRLRGHVHDYRPSTGSGLSIKLVQTFHPAFLLRSPDRKRDVWEDMKKVRALLNDPD